MKPAQFDLPVIWRGSTYLPIVFRWFQAGTQTPTSFIGWTPHARSVTIDFHPVITDPENGVTQISLTPLETAAAPIGVEQWDWIWTHIDGRVLGPYLSGTVQIKDPVTEE
jgi:hypothetical protein